MRSPGRISKSGPREHELGLLDIDMERFIFAIPCIMIQMLLCKPTKRTHFVRITVMFLIVNSYMFRTLLAHPQGVCSYKKQSFNLYIISSMQ